MLFTSRRCLFRAFAQRSQRMHFPRRILIFGAVLAAAGWLGGCATDAVTAANPQIPMATSTAQLRPGDSLTIALQGVPDASNNSVQIDEQGLISLPFVGAVTAAGLS